MASLLTNSFVSVTIKNNDYQEIIATKSIDESRDDDVCTICYSQIVDSTRVTLKCGHMYHSECFTKFIAYNIINKKQTITCPICRTNILEIVTNKSDDIHIVTGGNDIINASVVVDEYNTNHSSWSCMLFPHCGILILRLMIIGAIYYVLHFTFYCTNSNSC